jgi:hypothetical protein
MQKEVRKKGRGKIYGFRNASGFTGLTVYLMREPDWEI